MRARGYHLGRADTRPEPTPGLTGMSVGHRLAWETRLKHSDCRAYLCGGGARWLPDHWLPSVGRGRTIPVPATRPSAPENHVLASKGGQAVSDVERNKACVMRYWEACWNHRNPEALRETHYETFAQNGEPIGTGTFGISLRGFFEAFPDIQVTIEDLMANEDHVLTRVVYRGTQLGRYEGMEPTGRAIHVGGLELFLLVDGRIVQHWHEMDHLEILRQLGLPATSTSPSA